MSFSTPLAERMRPLQLSEYVGQSHLVGEHATLRKVIESGHVPSMILWGPPGVGKTTLANIIAKTQDRPFYALSAINSGVKEIREVLESAGKGGLFAKSAILFIDEIHRFSKSQQDALLGAVEKGVVTLIGATTENPSFEVNSALLSRSQVYTLNPLTQDELIGLLNDVITRDEVLKLKNIQLQETQALLRYSGGDARRLLNVLELVVESLNEDEIVITNAAVEEVVHTNTSKYDKTGEMHYDVISAFIKSVRGSSPQAAIYYLARMIKGGEDPLFIARRLVILASEDVGLANPNALLIAESTFRAVQNIGWPEARIPLSMCTVYLATSAKSNSVYLAIDAALAEVNASGDLSVPMHLRNAPTQLMKELGYGEAYEYAHAHPNHFVRQEHLPNELTGKEFYIPADNPKEAAIAKWLEERWGFKKEI
ncbi:MAG: replication-associated recombination protein A [Bacteroidetes bacterium]|nr:replication-associated recombination protein A [Bacteroidota bacterium]